MEAKRNTTCPICKGPRRVAWGAKEPPGPGFASSEIVNDPHYRGPVGHALPFQRPGHVQWLAGTEVCFNCWVEAWDTFARALEGWRPRTRLAMALGFVAMGYTQAVAAPLAGLNPRTFRSHMTKLRKNNREIANILAEFGGVVQHIYYRGGV